MNNNATFEERFHVILQALDQDTFWCIPYQARITRTACILRRRIANQYKYKYTSISKEYSHKDIDFNERYEKCKTCFQDWGNEEHTEKNTRGGGYFVGNQKDKKGMKCIVCDKPAEEVKAFNVKWGSCQGHVPKAKALNRQRGESKAKALGQQIIARRDERENFVNSGIITKFNYCPCCGSDLGTYGSLKVVHPGHVSASDGICIDQHAIDISCAKCSWFILKTEREVSSDSKGAS